jgi:hypothetical protein
VARGRASRAGRAVIPVIVTQITDFTAALCYKRFQKLTGGYLPAGEIP